MGGGSNPKPGEASLAIHGVLFLDEMAEFTKKSLDMLRQPLETGKVTISRTQATVVYPAHFLLIMNPCPCGYLESTSRYCTCTPKQVQSYRNRVSGPIEGRNDIVLSLQPVSLHQESRDDVESSTTIRSSVQEAREKQFERYGKEALNAAISIDELLSKVSLTQNQNRFLQNRSLKQSWSNRVHVKMICLARTISDIRGGNEISDEALWEAVTLRKAHSKQLTGTLEAWVVNLGIGIQIVFITSSAVEIIEMNYI
ncbi:ATP-binding protein [Chengkuizengella sp. SCS-71B]|uniref:ATP-binding protein n=1 Tax=Chengkuizengella sp. SCS-71B TaxID=3115290 RepID=UPI0032C23E34